MKKSAVTSAKGSSKSRGTNGGALAPVSFSTLGTCVPLLGEDSGVGVSASVAAEAAIGCSEAASCADMLCALRGTQHHRQQRRRYPPSRSISTRVRCCLQPRLWSRCLENKATRPERCEK